MNIVGCNYLAVIREAETLGEIYKADVYKINEVALFSFT